MVFMAEQSINRGIIIKETHNEWIEKNSINLSSWIRKKIEEEIKNE